LLNESPSRSNTNRAIGGFTYSNPYCKLLKYSVSGTDVSHVSVSSSTFTYKTNFKEPRTLNFNLIVHAQGDGINGKTHIQSFPSSIKIQGCDNESNTISNPNENAWKRIVMQESPSRGRMNRNIGGFTFSNAYCKLLKYSLTGTHASYVTVHGTTHISYKTDLREPFKIKFNLRVHA